MDSFAPTNPRIPPIEGEADDSQYELRSTTTAEVEAGLVGVLGRLCADAGRWILIIEVGPTAAMVRESECVRGTCIRGYLQWLCYQDGSFVAEVSSDASLHPAHQLKEWQRHRLEELGWAPPDPPDQPNYSVVYLSPTDAATSAALAVTTLHEVFDVNVDEVLLVKIVETWSLGPTPASEAARSSERSPGRKSRGRRRRR